MSIDRAATSAGLASEIIVTLSRDTHTFQTLMRAIRGGSDAVVAAALASLSEDGFVSRVGSRFSLTSRGRDLMTRCRPGRRK
jgi:DNA-binding HxlR family transcriptional regulator